MEAHRCRPAAGVPIPYAEAHGVRRYVTKRAEIWSQPLPADDDLIVAPAFVARNYRLAAAEAGEVRANDPVVSLSRAQ